MDYSTYHQSIQQPQNQLKNEDSKSEHTNSSIINHQNLLVNDLAKLLVSSENYWGLISEIISFLLLFCLYKKS